MHALALFRVLRQHIDPGQLLTVARAFAVSTTVLGVGIFVVSSATGRLGGHVPFVCRRVLCDVDGSLQGTWHRGLVGCTHCWTQRSRRRLSQSSHLFQSINLQLGRRFSRIFMFSPSLCPLACGIVSQSPPTAKCSLLLTSLHPFTSRVSWCD
jgi:hypothetical protein